MTSAGQILRQVACPARIATEERIHLFAPFPIKQGTYRIDHGSPLHRKPSPNIHNPRLFGNETFQPRRAKPPAPLRIAPPRPRARTGRIRSEEHTSELQSLMRISYAVFCLKKKNKKPYTRTTCHRLDAQQQRLST